MQLEEKPPGTPPFATPFEWIGGEDKVKALVDRFYDLMDIEPAYTALRAAQSYWGQTPISLRCVAPHPSGVPKARRIWALTPKPFLERDQWLACMDQAMGETGVDEALRARLSGSFFQTADWMRNTLA